MFIMCMMLRGKMWNSTKYNKLDTFLRGKKSKIQKVNWHGVAIRKTVWQKKKKKEKKKCRSSLKIKNRATI